MGRRSLGNDPLDEVLKPPPDETPEAKEARLAEEETAKRVSQAIDESIKAERQIMKKRKVVRLLLLGQSESGNYYSPLMLVFTGSHFDAIGKSTTLRRASEITGLTGQYLMFSSIINQISSDYTPQLLFEKNVDSGVRYVHT
jgi:hypothetical protein